MNEYEKMYESFTENEIDRIVQLKRFFERIDGDKAFREAVINNAITPAQEERLRSIGVTFDLPEVAFLWEAADKAYAYMIAMLKNRADQLDAEILEIVDRYPLLKLWGRHLEKVCSCPCKYDSIPDSHNKKFAAWRKRRIAAVKSELGAFGYQISHAVFAFELSDGCSVGCWFCSFAAKKLKGFLDYNTRRDYFRRIVQHCVDLFGKDQAVMALPYYCSEPHDNPSYIDFIKDYEELTGAVLCTSTAVGDDISWVRQLLDYYKKGPYPWPRLSVLSVEMLDKIHDAFSPRELQYIQLLMQMKEHPRQKVAGGRILKEIEGLRGEQDLKNREELNVPQGSIACVSGFRINLVSKTIELFSPCFTSKKWPYGYRVFDEAVYNDEHDFPEVVQAMIERSMFLSPPLDKPLRFRDDTVFRPTEEGFDLLTPSQRHYFKSRETCGPLGELIAAGESTYAQITGQLVKKNGVNPIVLRAAIQKLFDDGFIDEVY
ncbi:MAG: radical SAM family RiPP maturation amino acid epimerase [Peptococcaceae bacterium]|nr:radical SAM family RiPP maturation amino acid epimerase [Peptococcaceae bacterium]